MAQLIDRNRTKYRRESVSWKMVTESCFFWVWMIRCPEVHKTYSKRPWAERIKCFRRNLFRMLSWEKWRHFYGTNVNTGEIGGLWAYFEQEILNANSKIPLVKIWCVAHRANLCFKDLSKTDTTIKKILDVVSKIASHFNTSIGTIEANCYRKWNQISHNAENIWYSLGWTQISIS